MAATAGDLESMGRGGQTVGTDVLLAELGTEFQRTLTELRTETAAA
jgi:hypothetical protein